MIPEHWIELKRVPKAGESLNLEADEKALKQLADETPYETLSMMRAELLVEQWGTTGMKVTGRATVKGRQVCVVTLEPFETHTEATIERTFVPDTESAQYQPDIVDGEMVLDVEDDAPDSAENGRVDLWGVVVEEINLEADPFPRSPQADSKSSEPEEKEPTHRPFEGLNDLLNEKNSTE